MTSENRLDSHKASDEVLVRVEGVSKKFCRSLKKSLWYGLCDIAGELSPFARHGAEGMEQGASRGAEGGSILPATRLPKGHLAEARFSPLVTPAAAERDEDLRDGEFYAVRDVSFELRRGECLGLIGHNGAGKTTLLKMLNGLIKPDAGKITMRGRVGALIALGAGFNPILTGRENIYINGSVLGLSKKEIDGKIDEIIDFAEIGEFIDSPVQNYSSGMNVRLGFSVATTMNPDVLILDEVLAVGDAAFRNKCYRRVVSLRKKAAVIFVSHTMEQVARICDKALVMQHGSVAFQGGVGEGIQVYEAASEAAAGGDPAFLSLNKPVSEFFVSRLPDALGSGDSMALRFNVACCGPLADFRVRVTFYSASGTIVAEANHSAMAFGVELPAGCSAIEFQIPIVPLRPGRYLLGINLIDRHGDFVVWSYKQHSIEVRGGTSAASAECQLLVVGMRVTK